MKENVKVFLIALFIGMIAAFVINYKFDLTNITNALGLKATILYVASYNNLEEANNKKNNYDKAIIYKDNNIYKVVIGVYSDENTLALMESYFLNKGYNYKESEIKIDNAFLKSISNYELLIKSSETSYYENLNNNILDLFNEYQNNVNTN